MNFFNQLLWIVNSSMESFGKFGEKLLCLLINSKQTHPGLTTTHVDEQCQSVLPRPCFTQT